MARVAAPEGVLFLIHPYSRNSAIYRRFSKKSCPVKNPHKPTKYQRRAAVVYSVVVIGFLIYAVIHCITVLMHEQVLPPKF